MEKDIGKIQLPKDSIGENIEILSRKKFENLFDEERFILKPELVDNGVDYRVEIGAVWFEKVLERLHIGECKDWCAELSVWVFGMIAGWVGLEISNN